MTTTTMDTHAKLREGAKGIYTSEAGVELLIRAGFAYHRAPWIRDHGSTATIDTKILLEESGVLSGGERRIIRLAASLLTGILVDLNYSVTGLDRTRTQLVLAAISHATGTHDGYDFDIDADGALTRTPCTPIYPWPTTIKEN